MKSSLRKNKISLKAIQFVMLIDGFAAKMKKKS